MCHFVKGKVEFGIKLYKWHEVGAAKMRKVWCEGTKVGPARVAVETRVMV